MRQEHDPERDIMIGIVSDEPIVDTKEYVDSDGVRHVMHLNASGKIVKTEIHGYSKLMEAQAQTKRTAHRTFSDANPKLGSVEWEIMDCATREVVKKGSTALHLNDATINRIESPSKTNVSTSFPLTELFTFGLAGGFSEVAGELSGFAVQCDRTDEKTFCWEWFDVDRPGHAVKRQEAGELAIEIGNRGLGWEVIRTEFLTDVQIRVMKFGAETADTGAATWRVLIKKGSVVDWPSLVDDGTVVAG